MAKRGRPTVEESARRAKLLRYNRTLRDIEKHLTIHEKRCDELRQAMETIRRLRDKETRAHA